jgi:hypothetical protein
MARICFSACRTSKGRFSKCGGGRKRKKSGGKKRHCRFGVNKRTKRCLKHKRSK